MQRNAYSLTSRFRRVLLALLLVVPTAYGWDRDDRLAIMAADLLPVILGAQKNFSEFYFASQLEEHSEVREIIVQVLYRKKRYLAERTVKRVNNFSPIKGVKLRAVAIQPHEIANLNDQGNSPRKLIFIIENMGKQLNTVQESAIKNNNITYSSSITDVEKGVAVGLSVTERVLPVINESSLSKIQLQFSSLFMRIGKEGEIRMERKSNAQIAILAASFIAMLIITSGLYWFNIVKPALEDDMQSLASSMASARANEFAIFLEQEIHDDEDINDELDRMLAYTFERTQKQFFLSIDLELSEDFLLGNNVSNKITKGRKSCQNCFEKDYPLYSSDSFHLLGVLKIAVSNTQANTYIKTVQHLFIIGAAVVLISLVFLLIFIWNTAATMDRLNENLEYEVDQRTRKLSNEIDDHAQTQARLNTARDEIQRLERSRIAKTLHDGVGQVLQALKLGLQRLSVQIGGDNKQLVNELVEETGEAIGIIRDFCSELRPLHLERMSLRQALYSHVERLDRRLPTMQLTMQKEGDDTFELSELIKEQLFLIAVELLNNALKHSQATSTEVILVYRKDFLVLTVTDNGVGACLAQSEGLGLSVIKERCERIGASIFYSGSVEQGLEARCELPVNTNKL